MLEALDEMGIRPQRIAGSSIGAVIGALYAAGMRARQIRELVLGFFLSPGAQMVERIVSDATRHWAELVELELGSGGLLSSEGLIDFLYGKIGAGQLDDLATPLTVTTADLWSREPVVFESGPLIPAVQASMALPGVFAPVMHQGRVLIDGGTVRLPRLIGHGRAMDMVLTGRPVDATEALAWGLVDRVAPEGAALTEALELAGQIAAFPQVCLRADRASAIAQWGLPLEDALRAEAHGGVAPLREEAARGAARFVAGEGRGGA